MNVGKFIVIEGLEGAGKSSAIQVITRCLEAHGVSVERTREPGGTPMAEAMRECVKSDWQEHVTVEAELLLMYAARVQLIHNVIKPALQQGHWVVGDRHDMSSQAYQGGGREIPQSLMLPLKDITLQDFKPDFTLYLDVEPAIGLQRARGRGELDRIEQEDISFFERTRARYLAIAEADDRVVVINAMQPQAQVLKDIEQAINQFISSLSV